MGGTAQTLHEAFRRSAARHPARVAVSDDVTSLSYDELDARSARLARRLAARGTGPDGLVGLCVGRGVDLIVGTLGILRAGGAYVPLPPDYPRDRLTATADDAGLTTIVTDDGSRAVAAAIRPAPLVIGSEPLGVREPAPAGPANLAYVMYTSGSTGNPKGVQIEHRNVLSLMRGCDEIFDLDEHDVWALIHSYAFDFSVWEMWGALLHGGHVVVVPREIVRSPERLWDMCVERGVTVLSATPSYFAQLTTAIERRLPGGSLRYVVFGGEALNPPSLRGWYEAFGVDGPQLVNMYGITETTVHVTAHRLDRAAAGSARSVIGDALPHLEMLLLDGDLRPVAPGEVGEIHVAGAGVARGYYNRPDLTAARFVYDGSGRRLYRSGDLARRADDATVEYLGRGDRQVKIRGHRIELGEVEAALLAVPGIRRAVVAPLASDAAPDLRLVGYYVAADEPPLLRGLLSGRLPEFMVPAFLVQVEQIPLTPNGKADHEALAAHLRSTVREPADLQPPEASGGVAVRLAAVFREALEVADVPVDASFFTVGGDSVRVINAVKLAQEQGIPLEVEDIYRLQCIGEIAPVLAGRLAG